MFVNTDGGKFSSGFTTETNDCAVRAYSLFTGANYNDSHKIFADHGRRSGKGTDNTVVRSILATVARHRPGNKVTLSALRKSYPTNTLYILKRGHAFAMINGVVHDTWQPGDKTRVIGFYVLGDTPSAVKVLKSVVTPSPKVVSAVSVKELRARTMFDFYRNQSSIISNSQIARDIAFDMDITFANAYYYVNKFSKAV